MRQDQSAVVGIDAIGLTVSDLDQAVEFFTSALAFQVASAAVTAPLGHERLSGVAGARARIVRLRLGDELLELTEYEVPRGRPLESTSRSNDRWFQHVAVVVRDMDSAYKHILAHGARPVSVAPQRLPDWNPAAGGIEAFYFQDPDGHNLELIRFPQGKGDARWRVPGDALFRGLDHTAIAVADTSHSLAFYCEALGLEVVGTSENYGPEQEALSGITGAHLCITALRAAQGPGIELLEYLSPRDGRQAPADLAANDHAHWQIHVRVRDVADAVVTALRAGARPVSLDDVSPLGGDAPPAAALVRDLDGHGIFFIGSVC